MASIKLYLDTRKRKNDEPCPLCIIISHKNRTAHLSTGVKVLRTDIDMTKTPCRVINGKMKALHNQVISTKFTQAQRCLLELTEKRLLDSMSVADIKNYIESNGEVETCPDADALFMPKLIELMDSKESVNSYNRYNQTKRNIELFCNGEQLTFRDITTRWLENFDAFLKKKGHCINTRAIHLRAVKCIFNRALDEDIIDLKSPFRKFKIKEEQTKKRDLGVEQLRKVMLVEGMSDLCIYYRDIFMMSFYLIGMNTTDLYLLKKDCIVGDRIEYVRAKTGKHYSILIPDVVKPLLEKYRARDGSEWLLCMHEKDDSVYKLSANSSHYLKSILPKLSMYWARHSWASIAYSIGISTDVIALALGHSMGNRTTAIYINPDLRKVDEANRKVIDFVLQGTEKAST